MQKFIRVSILRLLGLTIAITSSGCLQSKHWLVRDLSSRDCNKNGVPDETDIANGDSKDENRNGIPDECE